MTQTSKVTELAQYWHDEGDDDAHVIYQVSNEIVESTIEKYELEVTDAQQAQLEMLFHDIVEESIDWDELAAADENARGWYEARQEYLEGKGGRQY